MSRDFGVNQAVVEEQFLRWAENPSSVSTVWRKYFDALPRAEWPELTIPGTVGAARADAAERDGDRPRAPRDESAAHDESAAVYGESAAYDEGADGYDDEAGASSSSRGNGHDREASDRYGSGEDRALMLRALPPSPVPLFPDIAIGSMARDRRLAERRSLPPTREVLMATELQGRVSALVNAFRVRGHLFADLDPLGLQTHPPHDLLIERYGLADVDESTVFASVDIAPEPNLTLGEIVRRMSETYTRTIGVEHTSLEDRQARDWLRRAMEHSCNRLELSHEEQLRILTKLTDAEIFEQFLHTKYVGAKRFSLEGGESLIPMLDCLVERGADLGIEEIVIGMAHRGRLNVMVNVLEMDVRQIFAGFEDASPELHFGGGDVKYHLGYSLDRTTSSGRDVHMTLTFNPSHLEFVNPVVEGRVRAKQDRSGDVDRSCVLPLLIHGDASFAGQGIITETLNLAHLTAYDTGGTVHVVVNNQIGFTTMPEASRSTRYCTDVARMLRCPVFHVNGEDPEAVAQVVRLAIEYRQRFHDDVVIDLYCYRKYGHNEGDEPRFTQPLMYAAIDQKRTIRQVYVDRLVELGSISHADAAEIEEARRRQLERALDDTRMGTYHLVPGTLGGLWAKYQGGPDPEDDDTYQTAVPRERLVELLRTMATPPPGFTPHPRVQRFVLDKQAAMAQGTEPIDWGGAENLAIATLLVDGTRCRLTGQDVRRGTFSHRHAVIFDVKDGRRWTRLGHLSPSQAQLELYDSPLSEAGVLGFEWGYSLDSPDTLVAWEAQFGDFANVAQVIIDQFLSSSEDKWKRLSGLVLLLPHGFEGQGPEHSSARLERFLNLASEDNLQICNVTTPSQLFHLLRRQVVRSWRKPLVLMSPKSLLRHKRAVCSLDDLATGRFERILADRVIDPARARRVLLCAGKIYFDLLEAREARGIDDVAIVRMEQLYPFRKRELHAVLAPYRDGTELRWVQEEPWNMGPWFFVNNRIRPVLADRFDLTCIARAESASPATGSGAAHRIEQERLVDEALR